MSAGRGSLTATQDPGTGSRSYVVEIREPDAPPRRHTVDDIVEIGRRAGAPPGMVTVGHRKVSRRHARLQVDAGQLTVTDLGSMNGTMVDGARITGPVRLTLGDSVRLGDDVELVVVGARTEHRTAPGGRRPSIAVRPAVVPPRPRPPPARLPFPTYLELPRRIPLAVWRAAQVASVAAILGLCVLLVGWPAAGLPLLWAVIVPLLPAVFLVAPGLWRNVCPLAAVNQLPRLIRWSRSRPPPRWLREHGYVVAVGAFVVAVPTRLVLFEDSGVASAALLLAAVGGALAGGLLVAGKAGWCSSVCPLFPIQRVYGQTPFVTIANQHCRPCVGCAKNCYDFNPRVAYQADLHDNDPQWTAPRVFFAGALPGIVLGYFAAAADPGAAPVRVYLTFLGYVAASAGSFLAVEVLTPVRRAHLAAGYGAVAFTTFYWLGAPGLGAVAARATGIGGDLVTWPVRIAAAGLAAVWLWRTFGVHRLFLRHLARTAAASVPAGHAATITAHRTAALGAGGPEVTFAPQGQRVVVDAETSLLEVAERDGLPIEAGCRMGLCGADPVRILDGAGNLSPPTPDETATLGRLGLTGAVRLACCARVRGPVTVSVDGREADRSAEPPGPAVPRPRRSSGSPGPRGSPRPGKVQRIVVIGNGVAGATAAGEVRRLDPDCAVDVVGREAFPLYNRMGIARVVYGRSAMGGLFLLGDDWYEQRDITCWLNTSAAAVDMGAREVILGTGDRLPYDRLILATGARAAVPALPGDRLPGWFVLREATDAVGIRAYVQETRAVDAVVVGAGPLGVEAACALHELGLAVTLLARGPDLLRQHVDARCAALIRRYLTGRGIVVRSEVVPVALDGADRLRGVVLADGRRVPADLALACTGMAPEAGLARAAGIPVGRGVLVDTAMRARVPDVLAAGDVAEVDGRVAGLWPAAVAQATTAAHSALGIPAPATDGGPLPVLLKGLGIDVASVGRIVAGADDTVVHHESPDGTAYGRLVLHDGRIAGAVLLNLPADAPGILAAVRAGTPVDGLPVLRSGRWQPSATTAPAPRS